MTIRFTSSQRYGILFLTTGLITMAFSISLLSFSMPSMVAMVVGASTAAGPAFALALLIGIQNIPEGIAAYKEMRTGKTAFTNSKKPLYAIGIVSIIPVILGLVGLFILQGLHYIIGSILVLSAGGIFYMLFYDMIPKAHQERK